MAGTAALVFDLHLDASNEALGEQMRLMAAHRAQFGVEATVGCTIGGFDADPRELHQIPEVRAFARRLVDQSFISMLDVTHNPRLVPPTLLSRGAMGALEVWLLAIGAWRVVEGGSRASLDLGELKYFAREVLPAANAACDKYLAQN